MESARILIVEDEALIAEYLRLLLTEANYHVVGIAESGEEALDVIEALLPDLVTMDGTLRGALDGLETGHRIQQSLGCPIVYVTADPRTLNMPNSVQKPFTIRALLTAVSTALAAGESPQAVPS